MAAETLTQEMLDKLPPLHFWQDGLTAMASNSIQLLGMAGQPVTPGNILKLVESAARSPEELATERWHQGYCSQMLESIYNPDETDSPQFRAIYDYFLVYFPARHSAAQQLLVDSFKVILGAIDQQMLPAARTVHSRYGHHFDCPRCKSPCSVECHPVAPKGMFGWLKRRNRRGR